MQRALDGPFLSVSASHNLFWKLRNEFRGEVALWLRRESHLLADLCVSPHSTDLQNHSQSEYLLRNQTSPVACSSLMLCQVDSGDLGR